MLRIYIAVLAFIDQRAERDDRGDVLAFLAIGALVITCVVFAVPQVKDLITAVLDKIKNGITGLT